MLHVRVLLKKGSKEDGRVDDRFELVTSMRRCVRELAYWISTDAEDHVVS